MKQIVYITPDFAVAGQLAEEDFAVVARHGFRAVINNRPDNEERGQLNAAQGREAAEAQGLAYAHIPTTKHEIFTEDVVGPMAKFIATSDGPVLAHCKSGQRSAIVWAAAAARSQPVSDVIAALADAGFDFGYLRDELDRQAHSERWPKAEPVAKPAASQATSKSAAAA